MPELIVTGDGSHSLFHPQLNETYHSTHGAVQESEYVFVRMGLDQFASNSPEQIRVLEIGFGTGLNALLALKFARTRQIRLIYHTLEAYPLRHEVWKQLNYGTILGMNDDFQTIHSLSWGEQHALDDNFTILKTQLLLEEISLASDSADVVFYDAFAPSKQPEMWTRDVLNKVCSSLPAEGIFVTYCAKGQLKRDLRDLGLIVETLPGPPGKKEMIRAKRPASPL